MDRKQVKKHLFFWYLALWVLLIISLYLAYGVYFVDLTSTKSKWVGLFAGAISILVASLKCLELSFSKNKNPIFVKLTKYFKNGALLFLKNLFRITLLVVLIVSCFLFKPFGTHFVSSFVVGAIFSFATIFFTTLIVTNTSTRSSQFYNESINFALKQIGNSSIAISLFTVAFSIIPLVILYHITKDYQVINGFILGTSLVCLINNVSTSISKKAVSCANDVANDYIKEVQKNDRRNPLLLLSGLNNCILGASVLSCDLFSSFAIALVSCMTIGGEFLQLMGAFLPIIVLSTAIFSFVLMILLTDFFKFKNLLHKTVTQVILINVLFCISTYYVVKFWLPDLIFLVVPVVIGAISSMIGYFIHINYLSIKSKPVYNLVNATNLGFESSVRQIIKEGSRSVFAPILLVSLVLLSAFLVSHGIEEPSIGLYGVLLAILSSVSSVGMVVGVASFGLTIKNTKNILNSYEADMYDEQNVVSVDYSEIGTKILELSKNFINIISVLVVVGIIYAATVLMNIEQIDILNPYVLVGALIGASVPYLYSGFVMGVVSKNARRLTLELKYQLARFPQIVRYEMRPDYEKCVELSSINSAIQVAMNVFLILLFLYLIYSFLNNEAIIGFLFGILLSSISILFFMNSTSSLAIASKTFFEKKFSSIKNITEFASVSINEEIFKSFKDLISPSLNALIKFIAVLILAFVPLFI